MRHDGRGYVSVGFPIPSPNFTATLEPRNADEHDLLLTSRSRLAFPGHYLSSVDSERDALTVLKLLSFQEQIYVYVTGGALKTDPSAAGRGVARLARSNTPDGYRKKLIESRARLTPSIWPASGS